MSATRAKNRSADGVHAPAQRINIDAIRAEFPALSSRFSGKRMAYLDNACSALKSKTSVDAASDFYLKLGACGGKRSTHLLAQAVEAEFSACRSEIARFLNADSPNEIAFTSGTTEAIHLVARGFPYAPKRNEVVITAMEHNSVFLPFHQLAEEGRIRLRICPADGGLPDLDVLRKLVTERTALVCMPRSSNVFGGEISAAEVARIVHAQGAKLLLDDAQFLSSHREDVQASQADFVAFSAHKIGGPNGTGVLYGKEHLLNSLRPVKVGGGTVKDVRKKGTSWEVSYLDAPQRLEAGVQNIAGAIGMAAAVRLLESWGYGAVRAHVGGLARRAAEGLARIDGIRVLGDVEQLARGALVSFVPERPDFSPADFNLYLNHELGDHFVAIRVGEHCAHVLHRTLGLDATIRASFFVYNTAAEIDLLLDGVRGYLRELGR